MIQLLVLGQATFHFQLGVVITFMYFDNQKKHSNAYPWLGHMG
jgi:hypothetical protein